jgi:hypothetical protein
MENRKMLMQKGLTMQKTLIKVQYEVLVFLA